MDDTNYQVDKIALVADQEKRAAEKVSVIEKNCAVPFVAFLKQNYEHIKIRNVRSDPEYSVLVMAMILKMVVLSGIKGQLDPLNMADISKYIDLKCQDLTFEEIYKAFELERFGEYDSKTDHFNLFNSGYFSAVISKYRKWKAKVKFEHNISISGQDKYEMSDEEKCKLMADGVLDCYIEWCETEKVPDYRFNVFDILYDCGMLPKWDESDKISHSYAVKKETARIELMKEVTISSLKSIGSEKKKFVAIYDNLKNGHGLELENRTKALVLKGYFEKIKEKHEHPYKFLQDNLAIKIHLAL